MEYRTWEAVQKEIQTHPCLLVYLGARGCGVCHADRPRVETLANRYEVPMIDIETEEAPEIAGQLGLFTVPAVLVFVYGREYLRQVRFLDFRELEYRLDEIRRNLPSVTQDEEAWR